jgi:hypothetical protein
VTTSPFFTSLNLPPFLHLWNSLNPVRYAFIHLFQTECSNFNDTCLKPRLHYAQFLVRHG